MYLQFLTEKQRKLSADNIHLDLNSLYETTSFKYCNFGFSIIALGNRFTEYLPNISLIFLRYVVDVHQLFFFKIKYIYLQRSKWHNS